MPLGLDTGRAVRLEGLSIVGANGRYGVLYQPSDTRRVRAALASLPIRHDEFTFIDFGSGKGRVLLVAAAYTFRRIIGVEFAEELHHIAGQNIRRALGRDTRAEAVCCDAAEYELPNDPLVLYFYNPFMAPIMRRVMANVSLSLRRASRPAYVILRGEESLAAEIRRVGFRQILPAPSDAGQAPAERVGEWLMFAHP
jgi:SAM-dependent methyltransferase